MFNFHIESKYNLLHLRWISSCMTVMQTTIGLWPNHHMRSVPKPKLICFFLNLKKLCLHKKFRWQRLGGVSLRSRSRSTWPILWRDPSPSTMCSSFSRYQRTPCHPIKICDKDKEIVFIFTDGDWAVHWPKRTEGGQVGRLWVLWWDHLPRPNTIYSGRTKSLYDIFILLDAASPDNHQTAHYGGS